MEENINELRKQISDFEGLLDKNDMEELWPEIL